jgi:galactose-1-phosphate uridylyltransferase
MTNQDGKWHSFAEDHSISKATLETIRVMATQSIFPAKVRFQKMDDAYKKLLAALDRNRKETTNESEHKSVERG